MAEYIEREALFEFADKIEAEYLPKGTKPVMDMDRLRYLAIKLPDADVVEVVRYVDCKHYIHKEDSLVYDDDYCEILYYCDGTHRTACERDFCSYGERKE